MGIIILFLLLGVPAILSIINLGAFVEFFTNSSKILNYVRRKHIDVITIVLGVLYNIIFWNMVEFREYYDPIQIPVDLIEIHTPISGDHLLSLVVFFMCGYVSYMVLRYWHDSLPPLVYVITMSSVIFANLLGILFIVQLSKNVLPGSMNGLGNITEGMILLALPVNFLVLSFFLIKDVTKDRVDEKKTYNSRVLNRLNLFLLKHRGDFKLALFFMMPVFGLITSILVLFGQSPDSLIQAFTQTSDWTLSKQVSPPPVEVDGHYLCTVSLRGHKKLVRPLRMGVRRGNMILVNRQLMIANAFEDLLQVSLPKTHRAIRRFYDTYGYPLSDLITTKYRADVIYLLMKPLEIIFVTVLYLFDSKPENRIAVQYLPNSIRNKFSGKHIG